MDSSYRATLVTSRGSWAETGNGNIGQQTGSITAHASDGSAL